MTRWIVSRTEWTEVEAESAQDAYAIAIEEDDEDRVWETSRIDVERE